MITVYYYYNFKKHVNRFRGQIVQFLMLRFVVGMIIIVLHKVGKKQGFLLHNHFPGPHKKSGTIMLM